jgi:peptidoglycan/LPS O-acetylase OafA/YrhL
MSVEASATPLRHIPSLDGLRACSFLLVFVAHAGLDDFVPGGFGVTVFFFLSGYLITTLMRAEFERNGAVNLKHFWIRRALRILPPFYLVLAIGAAAAWLFAPASMSLAGMLAQALHVTNYWIIYRGYDGFPAGAGTGVYWSLAIEEHFYLLFPFIYIAMCRGRLTGRQQALVFWGICALVLIWRCMLVYVYHASTDRTYMGTDTRVDSILFGCALAVWHNPILDRERLSEGRWKYCYLPACVAVILITFLWRGEEYRETFRYSMQGAALTPLFAAAMRYPKWLIFRPLNWRPLVFLGVLSYSTYLIHFGVITATQYLLPRQMPALVGVTALALTVFLAWLIYRGIERPCARLRKRLTD